MKLDKKSFFKQLYIVSVFNLLIILFIASDYMNYLESMDGLLPKLYFILTTFSHFTLISILPLLLAFLIYAISKSQTTTRILFSFFSVFLIIVLKIDATIFSQMRYHLSPIVFNLVFGKRASDIFQFSTSNILMALLFIILTIAVQFLFFKASKKVVLKKYNLRIKTTVIAFMISFVASNFIFAWSDANFYRPVMQFKKIYPVFFPLTADSLLMKLGLVDADKSKRSNSLNSDESQHSIQYPLSPIVSEAKEKKKNVLFLIVDTWRFDCMTKEITPNIYNFSQKSQVFTNHNSGGNMTTSGIFTLFYGIPATYFLSFTEIEKQPVLIQEFQKQKYNLLIFGSATLENPPFNRNVFSHIPNLRLDSKAKTVAGRDIEITNEWMAKMESNKATEPFFGFLLFDGAHGFDFPEDYKKPFNPSLPEVDYLALEGDYEPSQLINRYKNALHFVDSQIGKILKQLDEKKLLENTIIVITGDHSQEFNDNKKGYWQHGGNFSKYQIQVPMLIYDASKTPKTYNHLSLHYDIVPTLMADVLGVKNPLKEYCFGQNMFNTQNRDWFVCGYNQKYSVISTNRITNIYESGLYDILNKNLNSLDEEINFDQIAKAFELNNRFYIKKPN